MLWTKNFFVQALLRYNSIKDIWKEQIWLAKYGNINFESSIYFTGELRKVCIDTLTEWIKEEKKAEAKKDASIFKGFAKMLSHK